jgi:hypothetical protein
MASGHPQRERVQYALSSTGSEMSDSRSVSWLDWGAWIISCCCCLFFSVVLRSGVSCIWDGLEGVEVVFVFADERFRPKEGLRRPIVALDVLLYRFESIVEEPLMA